MENIVNKTKKIVCLLKNYEAHAKEMNSIAPSIPEFFLKPTTSILLNKKQQEENKIENKIEISKISHLTSDIHHEVEIGVIIKKNCKFVKENEFNYNEIIKGFFIALDLTARDLQLKAKKEGKPWTMAKGFDHFCPIHYEFIPNEQMIVYNKLKDLNFYIKINGELKQYGNTNQMIHSIPKAIERISEVMTLEENDLILMGTPEGVGPIKVGDVIEFGIEKVVEPCYFNVV
ncbi:hypothetical protein ABK040_008325 [Willaertia magna]